MIQIESNGALNCVVDGGRMGLMGAGVSRAGAMDPHALSIANWLVGNDANAAALEVCLFPFRLRLGADTTLAVTGAIGNATINGMSIPPWWSLQAREGDILTVPLPHRGARVYIAFAGAIQVPAVLNSRSTDIKSGFGGFEGRGLRRGDHLALHSPTSPSARTAFGVVPPQTSSLWNELDKGVVSLRVLPAAEYVDFTSKSKEAFRNTEYIITAASNRTGARLSGMPLKTSRPLELSSHGIVPGTIQVPPHGEPIVQLVEANTCGGYPKIATVIEADLWRFGQLRAGVRLHFVTVDREEAIQALRTYRLGLAATCRSIALATRQSPDFPTSERTPTWPHPATRCA